MSHELFSFFRFDSSPHWYSDDANEESILIRSPKTIGREQQLIAWCYPLTWQPWQGLFSVQMRQNYRVGNETKKLLRFTLNRVNFKVFSFSLNFPLSHLFSALKNINFTDCSKRGKVNNRKLLNAKNNLTHLLPMKYRYRKKKARKKCGMCDKFDCNSITLFAIFSCLVARHMSD